MAITAFQRPSHSTRPIHAEKVKDVEKLDENDSGLKVKAKFVKANTAPTGAKMRMNQEPVTMPIGPIRAKARNARNANHRPNHQRVDNHTVQIRARVSLPIQHSGKSLTSKVL